jgi:hypothetical protein
MNKKINLHIVFLTFSVVFATRLFSQGADVIYAQNVISTVTIYTDAGQGSGFFIAPNIIATNYHVVKDAYDIQCKIVNSDAFYDCDVIMYDEDHDLALCRTSLNRRVVKFSRTPVRIGQQLFVIGSPIGLEATFSEGRVSNILENDGFFQMTAAISPGSSGGPVFNEKGELVGISTASITVGQSLNLAVPIEYLQELINRAGIMNTPSIVTGGKSTESYSPKSSSNYTYTDPDYRFEVFLARKDNLALSLDYLTTIDNSTCFYFNYEPHDKDKVLIKSGDVFVRDRKTGVEFPCRYNELKSDARTIYPGTSSDFCVCSNKLPDQVMNFDIIEKNGSGLLNMYDLNMSSFQSTDRNDYLSYINRRAEGTIAFYSTSPCGDIEIKVDGNYVGTLTGYFADTGRNYTCGIESNAMLNLRLPNGTHNFEASCNGSIWYGDFIISEDCCKTVKVPN